MKEPGLESTVTHRIETLRQEVRADSRPAVSTVWGFPDTSSALSSRLRKHSSSHCESAPGPGCLHIPSLCSPRYEITARPGVRGQLLPCLLEALDPGDSVAIAHVASSALEPRDFPNEEQAEESLVHPPQISSLLQSCPADITESSRDWKLPHFGLRLYC